MEIKVTGTVFVELGPTTVALLSGGLMANNQPAAKPSKEAVALVGEETAKKGVEVIEKLEAEKQKAKSQLVGDAKTTTQADIDELKRKQAEATAPKAKAPKKDEPTPFEELDDEAKLAEIQTQITKGTKKGKSADIKFLLQNFEANRASNLAVEQYDDFYNALMRYYGGEAVTDIFPGDEENLA